MSRLFTSQTPASTDNSDGTPGIVRGMTVRFAVDGQVNGIWWYATTTTGGTEVGYLWSVASSDPGTGVLLSSEANAGGVTGGAWNYIPFDAPVPVTAGVAYRVGAFNPEGRYVFTSGFFTGADLVNGDITADADGDTVGGFVIANCTYRISGTPDYPNSDNDNGTNYFVDVDFTADGGTSPVSSSLDLQWQVRNVVASGIDLRWAVTAIAASPLDLRWAVRSAVTAPLDLQWSVRGLVSAAVDLRWEVRNLAGADLDLRWAQRSLASAPLDLRWDSGGRVSSALSALWDVRGLAASTLDLRWAVRGQISTPLELLWAVRSLAAAPLNLRWNVEGAPLPTVPVRADVQAILTQRFESSPEVVIRAILTER